ncbi:heterokaryon incompatibility protein-domain-containing protein, partial [Halenospora varia]
IDGSLFSAFENLEAALRRLRLSGKQRTIWIDAVCINQNDIQERQDQVSLMRQIYEQAEQVVIWLGENRSSGRLPMLTLSAPLSLTRYLEQWRLNRRTEFP